MPTTSPYVSPSGVGALLGRFQLTEGPCRPSQLVVQFTSEGSTLSGCDIQLVGTGYRLSLIKKRFAAGQFEDHQCLFLTVERSCDHFYLASQGNIWRIINGPVGKRNQKKTTKKKQKKKTRGSLTVKTADPSHCLKCHCPINCH